MFRSPLLTDLHARGLIASTTDEARLDVHLAEGPRAVYCGFDPSADSLHIGNLLPLMTLRRFQQAGHRPIVLVGGGTGLIGDPSGKQGERLLNPADVVAAWTASIRRQVSTLLDLDDPVTGAWIVDNYDWLASLDAIALLRDVGKHFAVSDMLRKESVRSRLGREGGGISFTEFSYMVLQSYDFLCLFRDRQCTIQIGGSDQRGNITAGVDLVRRAAGAQVHGLTVPLVTRADGTKFGKTESGTIWLDAARTSPYAMYQFWLNTADADVIGYLTGFTFLPPHAIRDLEESLRTAPEKRQAQRALAEEVTALVHGRDGLDQAHRVTAALFGSDFTRLSEAELRDALASEAPLTIPRSRLESTQISEAVAMAGLAPSPSRVHSMLAEGGIRLNGERIVEDGAVATAALLHDRYLVISRGKRHHRLVEVVDEGG